MGNVFNLTRPLREEDLDERLELLGVKPAKAKAQALYVTSRGDLSMQEAEMKVADDLAIAESFVGHYGLGCMESPMFDCMDAAMTAGMTCADIEVDFHEHLFVSTSPLARAGRAWDRFTRGAKRQWRDFVRYVSAPSPF